MTQEGSDFTAPKIYGIMVTRADYWVMQTWLAIHVWQFERLVILDGTRDEKQSELIQTAASTYENVVYANERDVEMPAQSTDNSLRGLAWSMIANEINIGSWVVVVHPDEFYLHKFADLAAKADAEGFNGISFVTLYAMPYSKDAEHLEIGIREGVADFNILDRVRYCQSDWTWLEQRMHKYDNVHQHWGTAHAYTRPEHFPDPREAHWRGWYIHYKVHNFDADALATDGWFSKSLWATLGTPNMYEPLDNHPSERCADMVHDLCNFPLAERASNIDAVKYLQTHRSSDMTYLMLGGCDMCQLTPALNELRPFCQVI